MDNIIPPNTHQKQCKECLNFFPATTDFFHRAKDTYDRLRARCKKCQKESDKARYTFNKEQRANEARPTHLVCSICEQMKPVDLFHKHPTGKYGLSSYCKNCANERTKAYYRSPHGQKARKAYDKRHYAEYREQSMENRKRWYQKNREYALAKDRQFRKDHPEILAERWQRWYQTENGKERSRIRVRNRRNRRKGAEGTYTYTDIQRILKAQKGKCYYCSAKLDNYQIEHVIPISRGGSNDPSSNIVLSCPSCNMKKGTKLPHEWPEGGRLF